MTLAQQAAALRKLKLACEAAGKKHDDLKAQYAQAQLALLDRMEAEETEGIKAAGVNFVPSETPYGVVQDRAAFVNWAEQNAPELVEPRERRALVNELVRERLDTGEELPPGLGFYVKKILSQRSA